MNHMNGMKFFVLKYVIKSYINIRMILVLLSLYWALIIASGQLNTLYLRAKKGTSGRHINGEDEFEETLMWLF